MSLAIAGGGAFGTALGVAIATAGRPVTLWVRDAATVETLRRTGEMPRLPGIELPERLAVTADAGALAAAGIVLLAVPAQSLRAFLAEHGAALDGRPLVSCAKGIDLETLTGPSDLVAASCPAAIPAVLTGPSFAADIARGLPTALTLACADAACATTLQETIATRTLRLYRTGDVTGAELGGALKNVIAIASGAAIGAGLGESARAAVITRGFAELSRLATALGAQAETLAGLSGFGDLVLTCTSRQSRNYRHGLALGSGGPGEADVTVEGAKTALSAARLARAHGIEMPITEAVAGLVEGRLDVAGALDALLARPLRAE